MGGSHLVYSPDGSLLATNNASGLVTVWDVKRLKPLTIFELPDNAPTLDLSFSESGDTLLLSKGQSGIGFYEWDIKNSKVVAKTDVVIQYPYNRNIVCSKNRFACYTSIDSIGTILIGDVNVGISDSLRGHTKGILDAIFFASNTRLVSVSNDSTIRIWDIDKGKEVANIRYDKPNPKVYASQTKNVICTHNADSTLKVFNASNGELIYTFKNKLPLWYDIAISPSPDSPVILIYPSYRNPTKDSIAFILDLLTGKIINEIIVNSRISEVAFTANGNQASLVLTDGELLLYDTRDWKITDTLCRQTHPVNSLLFSPKSGQILSAGKSNILFFNSENGSLSRKLSGGIGRQDIHSLSLSPSERFVAFSDRIWNLETDKKFYEFTRISAPTGGGTEHYDNIRFTSDSSFTYTYTTVGHYPWEITGHFNCAKIQDDAIANFYSRYVHGIHYNTAYLTPSHNHAILTTLNYYGVISGSILSEPICGNNPTYHYTPKTFSGQNAVFNAFGTKMLTVTKDSIFLWDLTDGSLTRTYTGHDSDCKPIGFSHNGIYFFSYGLSDSSIRVWEVSSSINIKTYKPYFLSASAAILTPDGESIIAGYKDGTLLRLDISKALDVKRERYGTEYDNAIICTPNPARNELTVSIGDILIQDVKIVDLNGKLVWSGNINGEAKIDIRSWASGAYVVQSGSKSEVFIKQK